MTDVFVTNFNESKTVNTIVSDKFAEGRSEVVKSNNILNLNAEGTGFYTEFYYGSKHYTEAPIEVDYTKEFVTYYGQKITVTKALSFALPEYSLIHSDFLVDNVDGVYQSYIQPAWKVESGKVTGFSVETIDMNDAFLLKKGETVLSKEDQKTASLDLVFSTPTGEGLPTIYDNVMTYNSPAKTAPVSAALFLVNTRDGAEYNRVALPIANAEVYAGYIVNQYNPLGELPKTATLTKKVDGIATYQVNVADGLSLKDERGRDFIVAGKISSGYVYPSTTDGNFFGIEMSVDVNAVKLPDSMKHNVKVTPVLVNDKVVDCTVEFNYTTQLQMLQDLEVKVPVKLTHTWGETETEITVKFLAPVK